MVFKGSGASSCSMERQKNSLSQLNVLLMRFDSRVLVLATGIILISDK